METYLFVSLVVVLLTGRILYSQGKAWSLEFVSDKNLAENANKILLVLFYLFNSGLILISILVWNSGENEIIYAMERVGIALVCIGFLHLINVVSFLIIFYFKLFQK